MILRFLWAYWRANGQGAMEFRASFLAQAGAMLLNNSVWIVFWWLYFSRFPVVKGWTMEDILWLWAIAAGAVGWVSAFFGNVFRLAHMIANGHLDLYLTMPKPVLLHLLVSRMSFSAWGDILFAWILFAAMSSDPQAARQSNRWSLQPPTQSSVLLRLQGLAQLAQLPMHFSRQ